MPQSPVIKVLVGSAAVLAQASGHLPTLPKGNHPQLGSADLAPSPALNVDDQLLPAPCFTAVETCPGARPAPLKKALNLPAPKFMTRAKNIHEGQPMVGCPMGDYTVPVIIGDPKGEHETFNMLFDTGSSAMGVFSEGGAAQTIDRNTYELVNSPLPAPAFTDLPQTSHDGNFTAQSYGRGEWQGLVAIDNVTIPGWPTVEMGFGEIKLVEDMLVTDQCDIEGNILNVAHGILGMDTGSYIAREPDVGAYQLGVEAKAADPSFSLALCDRNGTLVRGKPTSQHTASDFVYAAYQPGFYGHGIAVNGIRVGNQSLMFTNEDFGQTLVDSGSTAVSLPAPIAVALFEQVALQSGRPEWRAILEGNGCFQLPKHISRADVDASLPKVTWEVQDPEETNKINTWTFSATNFFLTPSLSADGTTKMCAFLGASQDTSTLLGNIINLGNWIHFNKNVGLAQGKDVCEELA